MQKATRETCCQLLYNLLLKFTLEQNAEFCHLPAGPAPRPWLLAILHQLPPPPRDQEQGGESCFVFSTRKMTRKRKYAMWPSML